MRNKGKTLHFINRLDETNCGDMLCSPLLYYYDFFRRYRIRRHDIRFIEYDAIAPEDVVILGGGGLFDYSETLNRNINRLLDTGACVIAWAPGFNSHTEYSGRLHTQIDFSRFALIAARDYENSAGLPYLPDVTCKMDALRKEYTVKRKIGVARHKDYPIPQFSFEEITNREPVKKIVEFIGESEIILSNSYHMIYWAVLMGKKVVCIEPFSSKFFGYRYKPTYYTAEKSLQACIQQAPTYNVLEECVRCNDDFFAQVSELIQDRLMPCDGDGVYESITREALAYGKLRETQLAEGDSFSTQLFLDTGDGFNENQKLVTVNNVYGDDPQTVEFDLSAFPPLRALRFDPMERRFCRVQILEAVSELGPVTLHPIDCLRVEQWDQFLTTDPQYFTDELCGSFLRIHFRLELMPYYAAEQAVKYRLWQQEQEKTSLSELLSEKEQEQNRLTELLREKEQEQNHFTELLRRKEQELAEERRNSDSLRDHLARQAAQLEEQRRIAQEQAQKLQQCSAEIEAQQNQLAELRTALEGERQTVESILRSRSWRITAPLRALTAFIRIIWKRG